MRLVVQHSLFHSRTVAYGVLPLYSAAEAFRCRCFKPERMTVALETPQGLPFADLSLEAAIFSSVRTRSIVTDAVRRMRLLAAAAGHGAASPARSVSATGTGSSAPASKVVSFFSGGGPTGRGSGEQAGAPIPATAATAAANRS